MTLFPHHQQMLIDSAICNEDIEARGYQSIANSQELLEKGFSPAQAKAGAGLLIPIWTVRGEVGMYRFRPDVPRMIRNRPAKYETPKGQEMCLDVPRKVLSLLGKPDLPLFVTEGEKKADSAVSHGLCCIALLGVWNFRGTNADGGKTVLADWEHIHLKRRQVYVVFDSDVANKPEVEQALLRLKGFLQGRGANVTVLYLQAGPAGEKVGLDDFFAAGHTVVELLALPKKTGDAEPEKPKPTASRLIEMGETVMMFRDDRDDAFARMKVGTHYEVWPVRSPMFKSWLTKCYFEETKRPPNSQAMQDALGVLESKAMFDSKKTIPLQVRTARDLQDENALWIDLADDLWRAVKVTPLGWEVVNEPPPLLRRYKVSDPHVEPVRDASIEELRQFVNVRDDAAWKQLVVWLVAALIPDIAHPILLVYGEHGSAKSTCMRLLSSLIDPSKTPLRSEPRDLDGWIQAADHSWLITLDNLSSLSVWLSDALCRAVYSEGFTKRALFTNSDEVIMSFRRVVALTSIEIVAKQPDLLDRSLLMPLEPIDPERRRSERLVMAEFDQLRPRLFGALLDLLSAVLKELPDVQHTSLPRMADFAKVGLAVEKVLNWPPDSFLEAFRNNIAEQHHEALYSSPLGGPIRELMEHQEEWEGTATELLDRLTAQIGIEKAREKDWPKKPRGLSGQLRKIGPNLRAVGIHLELDKRKSGGNRDRIISLTRNIAFSTVPAVPSVPFDLKNRDGRGTDGANSGRLEYDQSSHSDPEDAETESDTDEEGEEI